MKLAMLAIAATLCSACAPTGRVLSVAQIAPDRTPFHGQIVTIKGRVSERCAPLSCWLLSEDGGQHLSMARRKGIEPRIQQLAGRTILLRARVDATCGSQKDDIMVLCTDRASEIIPLSIIKVF